MITVNPRGFERLRTSTRIDANIETAARTNANTSRTFAFISIPSSSDFDAVNDAAEQIVKAYADGPTLAHGGSKAFYRPINDMVQIPEATRFASSEEYYSTLFHELAHSTGHSSRLDRGLDSDPKPFGSPDYGREELVAEMAAAFLGGEAGIKPAVIDNQAAYIGGWLKQIKQDKKLVIAAAGAAQKAADWIKVERGAPV